MQLEMTSGILSKKRIIHQIKTNQRLNSDGNNRLPKKTTKIHE